MTIVKIPDDIAKIEELMLLLHMFSSTECKDPVRLSKYVSGEKVWCPGCKEWFLNDIGEDDPECPNDNCDWDLMSMEKFNNNRERINKLLNEFLIK